MTYVIKVDYTTSLRYRDFAKFTKAIEVLHEGGLKKLEIIFEEEEEA